MFTRSMTKLVANKRLDADFARVAITQSNFKKLRYKVMSASKPSKRNQLTWVRTSRLKHGTGNSRLYNAEIELSRMVRDVRTINDVYEYLNQLCKDPRLDIRNMNETSQKFWKTICYNKAFEIKRQVHKKLCDLPTDIVTAQHRLLCRRFEKELDTCIKFIETHGL
tara:strand:- start:46 stop:543 length:498 start_codon:yes stop_codon:yes gene_type:complete